MASKSKKTETVRDRKKAPNKPNMKAEQKRIQKNLEVIKAASE